MPNLHESYDPSDTKTKEELMEEARQIEEPNPKQRDKRITLTEAFVDANYERLNVHGTKIERLESMLVELVKDSVAVKGVIGNMAMKVLNDDDKKANARATQIERDAKLLVAVLVADFKEGKTTGIPIEAGVLTESLGFKRPTDVYLDVQKKGL